MIIGISGYKQSGKSTVGNIIHNLLSIPTQSWEIKQFSTKLKEICSILTGIPIEDFEKEEVKSSALGEEWRYYEDGVKQYYTVRYLLQRVGTDAMRDVIHPDVWVNALMKDYHGDKFGVNSRTKESIYAVDGLPNWIITDVRFPNEAKAIKDKEGVIVRINRLICPVCNNTENFHFDYLTHKADICNECGTSLDTTKHSSEIALDDYKFDYVIENCGTSEELTEEVKQMLIHFKLL